MEESKKLIILDASVILKWFLEETEDIDKAEQIQTDSKRRTVNLGVSNLCFYEVMNTLARKAPDRVMPSLSALLMLNFFEFRLNLKIAYLALRITQNCQKVSFYDASYHATAIENNGTFITADEKYYRKTKSFKHITLLKDYPISPQ